MKTIALTLIAAVAALSSASAALLTSDRLLGSINPGTPSGDADEVGYINFLLTETASGTGVSHGFNNSGVFSNSSAVIGPVGGQTFTLTPGALVMQGTTVVSLASKKESNPGAAFTLGATPGAWLLAKYGNGQTDVFFIADLAGQQIQVPQSSLTGDGGGLSHYSLFVTSGTPDSGGRVPDGGATLILLGVALSGMGVARRSISKK